MATKDDILGGASPAKGTLAWAEQKWAEQEDGYGAPPAPPAPQSSQAQATTPPAAQKDGQQDGQPVNSYEALIAQFTPKPKTQEELAKEQKKYRRDQIFNAIGEGIQALSNLYFTTQYAPSMYNAKDNSVERRKVSYEKMLSDNKANALAYINAKKADDAAKKEQRSWEYKLGRDALADKRYDAEQEYKKGRDTLADERYEAEQEYKKGRDTLADKRYEAEQAYKKERDEAEDAWKQKTYSLKVKQHNDNVEVKKAAASATAARGVRGEPVVFYDNDRNKVSIYENVWKGSMQQVFDAMCADGVEKGTLSDASYKKKMAKMSAKDKDDFVKQNWHKSGRASQIMLALSKIDPATMVSGIDDDDGLGWGEDSTEGTDW